MSQLPKFVRERLRVAGTTGSHPDPDVLTAFSERALPPSERAVVMEHLARCGDCRDVVALALPATETAEMPGRIEHRQWFRGPVLRWGAALAGVLVIASVGIQQYRERHQSQLVAMVADRTRPAQNEAAKDKSPQSDAALNDKTKDETQASQPAARKSQSRDEAATPGRASATLVAEPSPRESGALSQPRSFGTGKAAGGMGGGVGAGTYPYSAGQGTKLAMNSPPQPLFPSAEVKVGSPTSKQLGSDNAAKPSARSMSETVEVQAEAGQVGAQESARASRPDQKLDLDREQRQQANVEPGGAGGDRAMSKAKPAAVPRGYVSAPAAPAPADSVATGALVVQRPTPAWTISSDGALQRSFDGGKTWHGVDVSSSAIAGNTSAQIETVTAAKEIKSDTRNEKKLARQASAAAVFRAVAATGSDVWAGGSSGALYHSTDAGDHWTRIFPLADSVLLTADITSIQSFDPQHITIDTAASEVWATNDAGRSWQKH
jgi:hypothetical protein